MAWISKNSAGMRVPRRGEAYLTEEMKRHLDGVVMPRYEQRRGALLPVLHHVQERWGWLPWQALEEVAAYVGITAAEAWDTASFYEEYWLTEKGAHVVAVCRSVACEVCGQRGITEACRARLGIEVGETTDDGKFTLIELECLGLCEGAPAALVDHEAVMGATPEGIVGAIDRVARGGDGHGGAGQGGQGHGPAGHGGHGH
ncbi:MAG: hypothetical protein C0468_07210 [Planctomyces sp.]|nr:hypothetical protein [Planctomyces sp.]